MTRCLPSRYRQPAAQALTFELSTKTHISAALTGTFALLLFFLLSNVAYAQSDSEISEEEAAANADKTVQVEFDFFGGEAPTSIAQLKEMQEHFKELSGDVKDATVSVQVGQSQGTGVIVTRDGYVMTAAHVIGAANRNAIIKLPDGTELEAKTLGLNRQFDSGLLKIKAKDKYPYLNPGVSSELKTGQWVMAIGHPGGWEEDRGLVYRIGRILNNGDSAISTDCSLVGGDSGGPLVDMNGDVVGIHSRIGMRVSDNVHVPVDVFSEQWDDLSKGRDWGRGIGGVNPANEPWIGMSMEGDTLVIESVVEKGPAEKAGIKKGDRILEIDGVRIRSQRRFRTLFTRAEPKDKMKIKIERDDKEMEIEVTVGSRKDADDLR